MTKRMFQIGLFVALCSLVFAIIPETAYADEDDYEWIENIDGTVTITKYEGEGGDVHIPEKLGGKPVSVIGEEAFRMKDLTRITIPENIKIVGMNAFRDNELESITLPPSVEKWGKRAFSYNNLTDIKIPEGVPHISEEMFTYNKLKEITLPSYVKEWGKAAFSYNELEKVTISEGITHIDSRMFSENKLTEVTLPTSLEKVGNRAFSFNELTEVTLPLHVKEWGREVFDHNELMKVTIPEGIKRIEAHMFSENNLTEISLPTSLEEVGDSAFEENKLTEFTLPLHVKKWGRNVFSRNKIEQVTIPEGITQIEAGMFSGNQLTEVKLPNSLISVGHSAFSSNRFSSITLPLHVKNWGVSVFSSNELTEVSIPEGVSKIPSYMFEDNKLTNVKIPASVTEIGYAAFLDNDLKTVKIKGDQVEIQRDAFYTAQTPYLDCDEADDNCVWMDEWVADKNVVIYGNPSSTAEAHARNNEYIFKPILDHTIQFDSNGGSHVGNIEAKKNGLLSEPPAPTKKGEAFLGWYTDKNLQIPWSFGMDRVNRDFTLYAKWGKQTAPTFKDVENHWSKPFVIEAVEKGILSGYKDNTFRPSNLLTRAQAASILVRALELEATEPSPFEDVKSYAETTQDEIAAAYEHGLVKGYGDQFNPGKTVTRAQFALMIKRAYELKNEETYEPTKIAPFPDIGNYDVEAQTAITLLYDFKIAEGSNGKFNPQNQTKRGHAAKMLVNTLPHIQ